MITEINIKNYILIDKLTIDFSNGLSIITGETGAGKSILIGALDLICGKRADISVVRDKSKKCIIEVEFNIKNYDYNEFFIENDLDYDDATIIRREILPNGKSRAFVNDSPVNLSVLKDLGIKLLDIHSQHQTLMLNNPYFQLSIVDGFVFNNDTLLFDYKKLYREYKKLSGFLEELVEEDSKSKTDRDYFHFLYDELEAANLNPEEKDSLEKEIKTLSNAELIKSNINQSLVVLDKNDDNLLNQLSQVKNHLEQLSDYNDEIKDVADRINSSLIELKDVAYLLESLNSNIEYDPMLLESLSEKLDMIFSLEQKHNVSTVEELIEIKDGLSDKLLNISNLEDKIAETKLEVSKVENKLLKLAKDITSKRKNAISEIEKNVINILAQLGMPHTELKIVHNKLFDFSPTGMDDIKFTFSANKGGELNEISKSASGGELSRLMLSVKSIISNKTLLPTIIFDEIDTGVSGDIADKVGNILREMSKNIQVIAITHLPQIASKADDHYFIYKEVENDLTRSVMKKLSKDDRIKEIAKMLSGEELTQAAIDNAKTLLN